MLVLALIIFILAAGLGLYLLMYVLAGKNTPKGVALIHGGLGATGIILLAVNAYYYPWQLTLFIIAALGGGYVLFTDLSGKKIPKLAAVGHGLFALFAIVMLALAILLPLRGHT